MRILLIENEPKVSGLVKRGLTAERYAVDVSADGREGLEYAEAYPYDLILLDLMLPRFSGVEVLQRIRRGNEFVPILVLTARVSIGDTVKLFEIGADDYLTKPFAFAEFAGAGEGAAAQSAGEPVEYAAHRRPGVGQADATGEAARQTDRPDREGIFAARVPDAEPGPGAVAHFR
jgi:DNA-binding response OmpR family regulator